MSIIDLSKPYDEGREHHSGWGLSQIGSCETQLVLYDLGFVPDPINARTQRLFKLGNKIEELMIEEYQARGITIAERQRKVMWGGKNGRIDGLLLNHDMFLWECKSMRSGGFTKLLKQGIDAYPHYFQQAVAYTRGLALQKVYVRGIYFTVMNKDTQDVWQSIEYPDFQTEIALEWKVRRIHKAVNTIVRMTWVDGDQVFDLIKEFTPPTKQWLCNYCGFKRYCFAKKKGVRDKWQMTK